MNFTFLQGKICVSARVSKLFTKCLLSDPRQKNDIAGYFWPRPFTQTVKCSLLDKKLFIKVSLVHRSRLVIFYFKEKFCVLLASASLLRDVYCLVFQRPCQKSYSSSYIWYKSFSWTVKCFFLNKCFSKFLWRTAHLQLLFTSRKSSEFRTRRQVACEMFISKVFWRPRQKIFLPQLLLIS